MNGWLEDLTQGIQSVSDVFHSAPSGSNTAVASQMTQLPAFERFLNQATASLDSIEAARGRTSATLVARQAVEKAQRGLSDLDDLARAAMDQAVADGKLRRTGADTYEPMGILPVIAIIFAVAIIAVAYLAVPRWIQTWQTFSADYARAQGAVALALQNNDAAALDRGRSQKAGLFDGAGVLLAAAFGFWMLAGLKGKKMKPWILYPRRRK